LLALLGELTSNGNFLFCGVVVVVVVVLISAPGNRWINNEIRDINRRVEQFGIGRGDVLDTILRAPSIRDRSVRQYEVACSPHYPRTYTIDLWDYV